MCHQYSTNVEGKHHDIESSMKEARLTNERMIQILKDNTGLDTRTIKNKLLPASDVWLTASELIELKAADQYL